jgi:hypothetical protein
MYYHRHKKNPPFAEAGFSILNYLFYTVIPPPLSAGKIMTTYDQRRNQ